MDFSEDLKVVVAGILTKQRVERSDVHKIKMLVPTQVRNWVVCPKRLNMTGDQFVIELAKKLAG